MHPLYNLKIELCLPFLDPVIGTARYCFGGRSAQTNPEESKGLAGADGLKDRDQELGIQEEEPEFDFELSEGEDPIGRLGYGVVSYFGLIYTFMVIFALITCINIPVMGNNSQWSAYANLRQMTWTAQYTAGNLGETKSRCIAAKLIGDDLSMGCNTGIIADITHMGVYAKDSEADQRSMCSNDGVGVSTGLSCASLSSKEHPFLGSSNILAL